MKTLIDCFSQSEYECGVGDTPYGISVLADNQGLMVPRAFQFYFLYWLDKLVEFRPESFVEFPTFMSDPVNPEEQETKQKSSKVVALAQTCSFIAVELKNDVTFPCALWKLKYPRRTLWII